MRISFSMSRRNAASSPSHSEIATPVCSGPRGAANAVHVGLRYVRQIEVYHMADAVDINSARRNVGRDQRADLALAEGGEHAFALVLRLVAVDRFRRNAGPNQPAHHLVGAVFRAREDEGAVDGLALQHIHQDGVFRRAIDPDDALIDAFDRRGGRRHGHLDRIAQHLIGELGNVARHGRGEQQRLALSGQFRDDLPDVVNEAHVEHAIGFVEHEKFDVAEAHRIAAHQIEQATRRGDEDIDAVEQRADLAAHRHAADGECSADAKMPAIGAEAVEDLA